MLRRQNVGKGALLSVRRAEIAGGNKNYEANISKNIKITICYKIEKAVFIGLIK